MTVTGNQTGGIRALSIHRCCFLLISAPSSGPDLCLHRPPPRKMKFTSRDQDKPQAEGSTPQSRFTQPALTWNVNMNTTRSPGFRTLLSLLLLRTGPPYVNLFSSSHTHAQTRHRVAQVGSEWWLAWTGPPGPPCVCYPWVSSGKWPEAFGVRSDPKSATSKEPVNVSCLQTTALRRVDATT